MSETKPFDGRQQLEFKEKILREELRVLRDSMLRTMQWAVTILASLQTAIFFVRKSVFQRYVAINHLPNNSASGLPISMHLIGTVFLLMIALICQQTVKL